MTIAISVIAPSLSNARLTISSTALSSADPVV